MHRSFGDRWSSWSGRGGRRKSCRASWSQPRCRSAPRHLRWLHARHAGGAPPRAAPTHSPLQADRNGRAVQLEAHYGRRGVLEIWLTLAPFGGNLEGIRAGSLAWFGVPPDALEPAQAALLVAIPRRPERLGPDRHVAAATVVRDRVLAVGVRAGLFDPAPYRSPVSRCPCTRRNSQLRCRMHRRSIRRWTCRCSQPWSASRGIAWKPCPGQHRSPC